ncbi:hypothetical protein SAMN05421804_102315 [Proteiniclasticum ruminis]|uniref:Uncharacterized protein n=1 Tax=Proteiniclasticum ruminis TaxID=398199 RepID=A0A1G8KH21_9CLOT|nr:hypothetical protein SAMN05421804_102315 [Proteiniclasticum ruminis]
MKLRRWKRSEIFLSNYAFSGPLFRVVIVSSPWTGVLILDNFAGNPRIICIIAILGELFMGLYSGLRNVCSLSHSVNKLLMK